MATDKIKTKKLNDLQRHALTVLLTTERMGFYDFSRAGIMSGTSSWLAKNGLTREVEVPVEGRAPVRAWTITDAGREAQLSGRYVIAPKEDLVDEKPLARTIKGPSM